MTNTHKPAVFVTPVEMRMAGRQVVSEVGIFLGVEEALVFLSDLAVSRERHECPDQDCEACAVMSSLWWQVRLALPERAQYSLDAVMADMSIRLPRHAVHNPR